MDLSELIATAVNVGISSNKGESVLSGRLRKMELTLREVDRYFKNHHAKESSEYYDQPLKFLKNLKLLELQLNDPIFRKIIMLQTLIFAFSLTHQPGKAPLPLVEADKRTLAEIEGVAKGYLSGCGQEGALMLDEAQRLFANELYWMDLKEGWKDRKKAFFRKAETVAEEEAKHKSGDV